MVCTLHGSGNKPNEDEESSGFEPMRKKNEPERQIQSILNLSLVRVLRRSTKT